MPWIEPKSGDVGHGVGGGYASLNNLAFSRGGVGGWSDENLIAFANGDDGWIVSTFHKVTRVIRRVEFPTGLVEAVPGALRAYSRSMARVYAAALDAQAQVETTANVVYAGGGHVACWLGSKGDDRGLYTTLGLRLQDAGLLGMGPDAAVGYKPSYQSNGPTNVREANGDDWQLTPGHAAFLTMYGARRNMWQEGFVVQVTNLPQPQVHYDNGGGVWAPSAAFAAGAWWIAYFSSAKGIVLHPFGSYERVFPILPKGDGWHRISSMGGNVVRIAIAKTEGEGPGDIWGYDIDVTTGQATPLPFWQGGTPTTFPFARIEDVNPPAPDPPLVLPAPTRKGHFGFFEFKQAQGRGPGNSQLLVRNWSGAVDRSIVITDETAGKVAGTILGRFIGGATVEEIEARAKTLTERPIAYWDANAWPRWPTLPKGAWCCVRMYMPKASTLSQFEADCRAVLASAPKGLPLVMVPQQYTSNEGLVGYVPPDAPAPQDSSALKKLAPLFVKMFNDFPAVVAMYPFSGYGRAGGLDTHPDMVKPWQDWSAQLTAPKIDAYPVPPDPPKPQPGGWQQPKTFTPSGGSMLQEKGGIVGVGGKFGRMGDVGTGLFKRRGIIWDGDPANGPVGDYEFTLVETSPGRGVASDTKHGSAVGADLTQYSTDETHQFYGLNPGEQPGEYETPFLYIETDQSVKTLVFRFPKGDDRPRAFVTSLTWVTQ